MRNTVQAGKYRHRITIRNAASDSTRDSFGGRVGDGSTVCTVWAEKQDWQGTEQAEGGRETASVTTKWLIRYRTDVTTAMEIVHGTDVYNISSVLDFDGTKRELTIISRRIDE